jgi:hypothetical protein
LVGVNSTHNKCAILPYKIYWGWDGEVLSEKNNNSCAFKINEPITVTQTLLKKVVWSIVKAHEGQK